MNSDDENTAATDTTTGVAVRARVGGTRKQNGASA